MKKIISWKVYDTEIDELLYEQIRDWLGTALLRNRLYRTEKGKFYATTERKDKLDNKPWEVILFETQSKHEVKGWIEEHVLTDDLEKLEPLYNAFGDKIKKG